MKVGAIEWKKECALLEQLRRRFSKQELTLRVDANGAFTPESAVPILNQLSELDVHSMEQPIQAGQISAMSELCRNSPIGIALDEELIGIHELEQKESLLKHISPQFIVLKPSLHGGFSGCQEWIQLAEENQIAWWMTSAPESSIGLNAIAQFTATYSNLLPQGLGTGGLYTNNFESSLVVEKGQLRIKLTPGKGMAMGGEKPMRQNQEGISELDLRAKGGYIPVGIKEKADDVPAMLSKNEFVFTADAVRGAGNGSVNKGAQKMYKLMKSLEKKVKKTKVA